MNKTFFPLFLTSLAGIVISGFFHDASRALQWMGLICGLLPLMAYHASLMKARMLSSTEIDSVYYFGFLVTIITLVSTAISIGLAAKKPDLNWVLLQFGLGLVATGYALFARLHLLAKSTTTAEIDVVNSTEKLAKNVEKVAREFDNASFQVKAFVERTEQRLAQYEQQSIASLAAVSEKFAKELATAQIAFQNGLSKSNELTLAKSARTIGSATEKFSEAISSLIDEILRMQNEAEGISFSLASQRISVFSTEMEGSIRSITASVHESATASSAAVGELTTNFNKSAKLAREISKKLQVLDGVVALVAYIEAASDAMTGFVQSTSDAESALSSLSVKTAHAEEIIRNQISNPLDTARFAQTFADFERGFAVASASFNTKLQTLTDVFPSIETSGKSLSEQMGLVAQSVSQMGDALNTSPLELNSAINHLNGQISAASNAIEMAIPELNRAVSFVADQLKTLDLKKIGDASSNNSMTNASA